MEAWWWTAMLACTAAAAAAGYGVVGVLAEHPAPAAYHDRAPLGVRIVWPLAHGIGLRVEPLLPAALKRRLGRRLRAAELDRALTPGDWAGTQLTYAACGAFVAASVAAGTAVAVPAPLAVLAGAVPGVLVPALHLRELDATRRRVILRELPTYLDTLTLAVEGGSSLVTAVALATDKAADNPLRRALQRFLAEIRSGRSRADALRSLDAHVGLPGFTSLVAALLQAEKTGASLGGVLRAQSTQRTNERFARAEKLAMQAPVKMLGPLILCIFPCTFLVLGFPVAIKLMAGY